MNGARLMDRLWILTFFVAIASDVLSGAIRYYTALAGAPAAIYLPKAMMAVCILLIVAHRPKVGHLWFALYVGAEACVALSNGVEPDAVAFWFWTVLPMFFAMLAPRDALATLNSAPARAVFLGITVVCALGVLVNYFDYFVPLPWVGKSAVVDGVAVHVTKSSFVGDVPRLTGFGRDSAATGLMLGLLSAWLLPRLRSYAVIVLLLGGAGLAIWGTTNKTALVALIIVFVIARVAGLAGIRRACFWSLAIAVVLPFASFVVAAVVNHRVAGLGSLWSFEDRFQNTWPLLLKGMLREHLVWLGIGPGGFGAASAYYRNSLGFNTEYADSMVLYALANVGLVGCGLLALLLTKLLSFRVPNDRRIWIMLLFLLISGVTTDIFESLGCLLFLGVTVRALWLDSRESRVAFDGPHSFDPDRARMESVSARLL
jgi:hypothetical protein